MRYAKADVFRAWLAATILSDAPSTLWALVTGADPLEATRAAGAMLVPIDTPLPGLLAAATLAHLTVSTFWTFVFVRWLPRRQLALWSTGAAAAVALLDLRVIAPLLFPAVASLPFWPQFADHLMWGACLGGVLQWRIARAIPVR
jgi:hypothetical protein